MRGVSRTVAIGIAVVVIIIVAAVAALLTMQPGGQAPAASPTATPSPTASPTPEKYRLIISTGSPGGIYNPLGFKIAEVVTKYCERLEVIAQESGASVANAKAIRNGDAQIALMQSDVAYFAYNGRLIKDFEGNPVKDLRALAALYPEPIQIVARADAGIKTIWDLKGKVVAVGNPGSGLYATAYTILNALGLWDKIVKQEIGFKEAAQAMKQGTVDAFFVVAGVPTPKIEEIATQVPITLVEVPDDALEKLREAGLGNLYLEYTIKAGSYPWLKHDVQTITVMALLVADKDVPDDVIYLFLKTMFDHLDEIKQVHARAKDISLEKAPIVPIPLHPGAEKFYEEAGVLKK